MGAGAREDQGRPVPRRESGLRDPLQGGEGPAGLALCHQEIGRIEAGRSQGGGEPQGLVEEGLCRRKVSPVGDQHPQGIPGLRRLRPLSEMGGEDLHGPVTLSLACQGAGEQADSLRIVRVPGQGPSGEGVGDRGHAQVQGDPRQALEQGPIPRIEGQGPLVGGQGSGQVARGLRRQGEDPPGPDRGAILLQGLVRQVGCSIGAGLVEMLQRLAQQSVDPGPRHRSVPNSWPRSAAIVSSAGPHLA